MYCGKFPKNHKIIRNSWGIIRGKEETLTEIFKKVFAKIFIALT